MKQIMCRPLVQYSLFLALCWSLIKLYYHFLHQQVIDIVCLPLGAGLVVHSGLIRSYPLKAAACYSQTLCR